MKQSTMVLVFAVAAAFAVCGCRYDKAGGDAGSAAGAGNSGDAANLGDDVATMTDDIGADEGSLGALTGGARFEEIFQRCTDVNFAPVYFGFDSTVVPQGEIGKLDAVAQHLTDKSDRVVVIEGNCDERGSNEYNMSLGENRAAILRDYLVQSGIGAERIQTRSNGEERPAVTGHDESSWRANRRGEFVIFQR